MSLLVGELHALLTLTKAPFSAGLKAAQAEAKVASSGIAASLASAGKVIAVGAAAAVAGLALVGIKATDMAADFQAAMANVQTLMGQGSDVDRRIKEMGAAVKEMALETGKSLEDLTGGLYEVIGTFGDVANSTELLQVAAKAGAAGLATTQEAISLIAAVTKSYGDTSTAAAKKVSDLAFQTMNLGVTTFPEMAAAMGRVIPTAAALKVSQEELFAVMATLTGVTGSTDEVVTQLRGSMTAFLKPSLKMKDALLELGYAGANAGMDLVAERGLVGAIQAVTDTGAAATNGLSKLFLNTNTLNAVLALTGESADDFAMKLKAMAEASGATEAAFQIQQATVNAMGQRIAAAFEVMMVGIGEKVLPALEVLLQWVLDHMPEIQGVIEGVFDAAGAAITAFIAVVGPVVDALAAIKKWMDDIGLTGPVIITIVGAIAVAFGAWALSAAAAAAATVIAAAPVIAVLGVIALAIFAVQKALEMMGLEFADILEGIAQLVVGFGKGLVGTFINIVEKIVGVLALIPGPQQEMFKEVERMLARTRAEVDTWGNDLSVSVGRTMSRTVRTLDKNGKAAVDVFSNLGEQIGGALSAGIEAATNPNSARTGLTAIIEPVKKQIETAKPEIIAAGAGLGGDLGEAIYDEFGEEIELGEGQVAQAAKNLTEIFGSAMSGVHEAAAVAGSAAMSEMAKAIRDSQQKPLDAFETLQEMLKEQLSPTAEIGRLIGQATSKSLVDGMKSEDPAVVAQTISVRKGIYERLRVLIENGGEVGEEGMQALRDGMNSKYGVIRNMATDIYNLIQKPGSALPGKTYHYGYDAGKKLADGLAANLARLRRIASQMAQVVSDYFQLHSPAKVGPLSMGGGPEGWGLKFGQLYERGLQFGMPDLGGVLAASSPTLGRVAQAAASPHAAEGERALRGTSSGGDVHYHYEAKVEGLVKARDPFEIARTLKRVGSVASRRPGLSEVTAR